MHMLNFYVILQFSPTILKFPKFELKHRFSMVLASDCSDTTVGMRTLSTECAAEAHWHAQPLYSRDHARKANEKGRVEEITSYKLVRVDFFSNS